jgi:large-conductance mechanosensitive channel
MSDQPINNSSLLEELGVFWQGLHKLSYDHLQLAALETKRAGESLVKLIIAGIMAGLVLSATWFGLLIFAVLKLLENGIMASTAILIAVLCNLLVALVLFFLIRHLSQYLKFPASVQSLKPKSERNQDEHTP